MVVWRKCNFLFFFFLSLCFDFKWTVSSLPCFSHLESFTRTQYYQQALEQLNSNPDALEALGAPPLKVHNIHLTDGSNRVDTERARVMLVSQGGFPRCQVTRDQPGDFQQVMSHLGALEGSRMENQLIWKRNGFPENKFTSLETARAASPCCALWAHHRMLRNLSIHSVHPPPSHCKPQNHFQRCIRSSFKIASAFLYPPDMSHASFWALCRGVLQPLTGYAVVQHKWCGF